MTTPSGSDFVFSTESAIWEVNAQWTGLVFGPAAAILQIAHPKVGHGVMRHSSFKADALGRLRRTLRDVNSIAFGTHAEAEETKKRLLDMHSRVRGTSSNGVDYHALDQELLIWVLATLVDASINGYELVEGPLPLERKEAFLADMVRLGQYFGIRKEACECLSSWASYEHYYQGMLQGDLLGSDPVCGELARNLVNPKDSLFVKILGGFVKFLPIETLPPHLLEPLTLKSTTFSRLKMRWFKLVFPHIFSLLPKPLKYYPRTRRRYYGKQ